MTKTAKILLGLAIGCLLVGGIINLGWINAGKWDGLYALLPMGAVFLGLFLIVLVLGKERLAHQGEPPLSQPMNEGQAKPLQADHETHKEAVQSTKASL